MCGKCHLSLRFKEISKSCPESIGNAGLGLLANMSRMYRSGEWSVIAYFSYLLIATFPGLHFLSLRGFMCTRSNFDLYTRYLSSCLFVGCTRSPRSHSSLCSRGFTPLPSRCILKSIGYTEICYIASTLFIISIATAIGMNSLFFV